MSTTLTLAEPTVDGLQRWHGTSDTLEDTIGAGPVAGLSATLGLVDIADAAGAAIPPLWHWLYFLPRFPRNQVGPDGHARRGGLIPPVELPRRMWAGSRLSFHAPLRVGDAARRVSTISSVQLKEGRSGSLVFVTVQHEVFNQAGLALTEEQDIVYRDLPTPGTVTPSPMAAGTEADWQEKFAPDEVVLFRYSALTFNSHRIHYDQPYTTGEEGYPGLVVHGPLIASLLIDLARRYAPGRPLKSFSFKALRPSFLPQPITLRGQPDADGNRVALWASDHEGSLTMQAAAELGK